MNRDDLKLFKSANASIRKLREARAAIYARRLGVPVWQITEDQLNAKVATVMG